MYRNLIVRGITADVSPDVIDEIMIYRYRQEFHLSYREVLQEPAAALEQAYFIWGLEKERREIDEKRDKLKSEGR